MSDKILSREDATSYLASIATMNQDRPATYEAAHMLYASHEALRDSVEELTKALTKLLSSLSRLFKT